MKVTEANKEKFINLLYSLVQAIKRDTEHCAEICGGVTEKDMIVIGFVGQKKQVKMSDIAEDIDAPMSTLTNIVNRLVDKKILIREHSNDDRRAINVTLSALGEAVYKVLAEQKKQMAEKLLSQYNEKEQELFLNNLSSLISSF